MQIFSELCSILRAMSKMSTRIIINYVKLLNIKGLYYYSTAIFSPSIFALF